jgi:hypothetical protein
VEREEEAEGRGGGHLGRRSGRGGTSSGGGGCRHETSGVGWLLPLASFRSCGVLSSDQFARRVGGLHGFTRSARHFAQHVGPAHELHGYPILPPSQYIRHIL